MSNENIYTTLKEKYIDKHLKIFPIIENNKRPLIENWQNDCSYSPLQISYWIKNAPNCNWGLPCTPNDLFVLDIDVHNINGLESAKKLLNDLKISEIDTLCQKTPSGGLHIIFKSDNDLKQVANTSNSFKDYPGIDVRSDGYIVAYPSMINDKQYVYTSDKEVKEMPLALKEFILSQKSLVKTEKEYKEEYVKPTEVCEGGRDTALFDYITNLYYKTRLDKDEITLLANDFNKNVCNPSLPDRDVRYKVNKAFKKDRSKCVYLWLGEKEEDE